MTIFNRATLNTETQKNDSVTNKSFGNLWHAAIDLEYDTPEFETTEDDDAVEL